MPGSAAALGIQHVFILMMENRSFDHMLGYSGIAGNDAVTGQATRMNGLAGNESNSYGGRNYTVSRGANYRMPADPHHEFTDIVHQLCGPGTAYPPGGQYPAINNSGYVAAYAPSAGSGSPGEVMNCYAAEQLPVLNALAREFVLCDNWYCSVPGPTWPNRMFVHAGSSGGLDHSPKVAEIADWETFHGFAFQHGNIYDRLSGAGVSRCLYGGDDFPMVAALKGIGLGDIRHYSQLRGDLAQRNYPYTYVFIEPSYDVLHDYKAGTSQHPLGDVTAGEWLIKETYESIRNSAVWNNSILIVTWDEHGGFYDHAVPPPALAPGDTVPNSQYNNNGFTFQQYGARVPAIVISPRIPRNLIDHRVYDHSCIPKLAESLFGLYHLTERDRNAAELTALLTLGVPRGDAPIALPVPADSSQPVPQFNTPPPDVPTVTVTRPADTANAGNLPAVVHSAMQQDLQASPGQRPAIVDRVKSIQTRAQAASYIKHVQEKVRPARFVAARRAGK